MRFFKGLMIAALALVSGPSVAVAQTATVKVPMCLQVQGAIRSTIPCTGTVPVDAATGNALNWADIFNANSAPSGKPAVVNTIAVVGTSAVFTPIASRPFNITISGGTGVAANIERSFDGGTTWYVKYPDSLRTSLPESFSDTETEANVKYRVNVTAIAGGSVSTRFSQ